MFPSSSPARGFQARCTRLFRDTPRRVLSFLCKHRALGVLLTMQNAAMIAGISLIINPTTPYASDMKAIVRLFMEQHPHDPKADDFTQQEATIVSGRSYSAEYRLPLCNGERSSMKRDEHRQVNVRSIVPHPSAAVWFLHLQRVATRSSTPHKKQPFRTFHRGRRGSLGPTCTAQMMIGLSSCKFGKARYASD